MRRLARKSSSVSARPHRNLPSLSQRFQQPFPAFFRSFAVMWLLDRLTCRGGVELAHPARTVGRNKDAAPSRRRRVRRSRDDCSGPKAAMPACAIVMSIPPCDARCSRAGSGGSSPWLCPGRDACGQNRYLIPRMLTGSDCGSRWSLPVMWLELRSYLGPPEFAHAVRAERISGAAPSHRSRRRRPRKWL